MVMLLAVYYILSARYLRQYRSRSEILLEVPSIAVVRMKQIIFLRRKSRLTLQ